MQLVIFDCDGVLVDTERIGIGIDVEVLGSFGWIMSEQEVVDRFLGCSDAAFRRAIEQHIGRSLPDDWGEQFEPWYRTAYEQYLRPVDGIEEALGRITAQTCVASSGTHEKMQFTLGLTGLYDRFAGRIFSATEVANGKPAPDLFLHAARQMKVHPAECVVVEDSVNGVKAARAASMTVLGYAGGLSSADSLEHWGARLFTDMRELPQLLNDLGGSNIGDTVTR